MTRRRTHLAAILSPDRLEVLCGRCGARMAAIHPNVGSRHFRTWDSESSRVVAFDRRGWVRRPDDAVWWVPPTDRRLHELGYAARPAKSLADARYPTWLPVSAECPTCGSRQTVDPVVLDVDPNRRSGYSRGSARLLRRASIGGDT